MGAKSRALALRVAAAVAGLVLAVAAAEVYLRLTGALNQSPGIVRTNPRTRFELVPGARGWTYDKRIVINSLGLRDVEVSQKKPPGTLRVLCLGDSYTFGTGVAAEETYPKQLEALMRRRWPHRRVEVLNFGIPGFNTAQEAVALRERALLFEPDVIVLAFTVANDAEVVPAPIPVRYAPLNWMKDLFRPLHLYQFVGRHYYRLAYRATAAVPGTGQGDAVARRIALYRWEYSDANPGWHETRAGLREIAALAERQGIRLLVMLWPILEFFDNYPYRFAHEAVTAAVAGRAEVLDLLPALSGLGDKEAWVNPTDPHPKPAVHGIAARALLDRLAAPGWR